MVKVEKHIDELRKNINQMVKLDINSEKFKELQKNNSHIFSKFVSAVNKESNINKQCFYPNNDECSGDLIFAHSIQKAKLSEISESGFIIRFEPAGNKGLCLKGIGSASTFKGFCKKHDQIFSEIENKDYEGTAYQKFLYFYRTFCKCYYDELVSIEESKVFSSLCSDEFTKEYEVHKNKNFENFTNAKLNADKILLSKNYNLISKEITLDKNYNIINSSVIWLHTDFQGNAINNMEFIFFTFNVFTSKNKTKILISYFNEYEDVFKFIQSQLIEKDLDEQKRLLNLLLTFEPRNLAYKKSNYDLWSEDDKNQFMDLATDECHINNNHFLEKINYDFFNEVN